MYFPFFTFSRNSQPQQFREIPYVCIFKGRHLGLNFNKKGEKNRSRKGQVASPNIIPLHLKGLHTDILSHSKAIFLASVKFIQ